MSRHENSSTTLTEEHKLKTTPKKYILGVLLGRAVGYRLRNGRGLPLIDRLMSGLSELEPLNDKERSTISGIYKDVGNWHGTGRYQIRNGERVDVLSYIAEQGKLEPQFDDLDFTGPMYSLSTARSRMYARVYADIHGKGSSENFRHGSALFWGTIFIGDIAMEVAMETRAWRKSGRDKAIAHFSDDNRASEWGAKINGVPTSAEQLLLSGSVIDGNYPMLFGIREGAFTPVETSRSVAIHEDRSQVPLLLSRDVTHLEVPSERVQETSSILRQYGHNIPVVSIEDCERYVSQVPFSQLVSGGVL